MSTLNIRMGIKVEILAINCPSAVTIM